MHTFHAHCLDQYRAVTGLPLDRCCPFKCFRSENHRDILVHIDDSKDHGEQGPPQTDAAPNAAAPLMSLTPQLEALIEEQEKAAHAMLGCVPSS